MVDASGESDLGRLEWIVGGEVNGQEEHSALVRTVGRAHDGRLPMEHVVTDWTGRTLCWGIAFQIFQFLLDAFQSHGRESVRLKRGSEGGGVDAGATTGKPSEAMDGEYEEYKPILLCVCGKEKEEDDEIESINQLINKFIAFIKKKAMSSAISMFL